MADTATSADIMRNRGMAQIHTLGPRKTKEALHDIQWDFWIHEFKKMSCGRTATLELTSRLNDDKKLVPHQSRPKVSTDLLSSQLPTFFTHRILECPSSLISSWGSAAAWWLCYGLHDLGFDSWQGQEIFLFSKTSRPVAGTNQPPFNWFWGSLPGGKPVSSDLHVMVWLRLNGAVPLLPLYAFMAQR
jgi:hypothetical protein